MVNKSEKNRPGIIARQSTSNAYLLFIGIGLGFLLTIFIYPNVLSPEEYGLTRVLVAVAVIGAQFSHLGVRNTIIRYYPLFKRVAGQDHGLLALAILVPLVGFGLFLLGFTIFKELLVGIYQEQSPLFTDYILLVVPLIFFILYFEVFNSYLRSLSDSVTGSVVSEVIQRVLVLLLLGFFFLGWIDFNLFIALFVGAYGVQALLMAARIYLKGELSFKINPSFIRGNLLKGMGFYGLFTLLGGLSSVIVWNIDVIMLGSLAGLEQTAVYAIAFYVGSVITVPQRALDKIALPVLSELFKKKDLNGVASVYQKSCLNQFIGALLIFGLIWINIDAFFSLLPEVYSGGKWVLLFIAVGKIVDMMTGLNSSIIKISKHFKVDLYATLFLIFLTVGTNLWLIPLYGINGAAIATMVSLIIYNGVKFVFIYFKYGMQPLTITFLGLFVMMLTSILISYQLPEMGLIPDVIIKTTIFMVLFVGPVFYFKISEDLNNYLRHLFNR